MKTTWNRIPLLAMGGLLLATFSVAAAENVILLGSSKATLSGSTGQPGITGRAGISGQAGSTMTLALRPSSLASENEDVELVHGWRRWGWGGPVIVRPYWGWGWGGGFVARPYWGWGWSSYYVVRPWGYYPGYCYPGFYGWYGISTSASVMVPTTTLALPSQPAPLAIVPQVPHTQPFAENRYPSIPTIPPDANSLPAPRLVPQNPQGSKSFGSEQTYPYDGGPNNPVPLPRSETLPRQSLPATPTYPLVPTEGQAVSLPIKPAPKYQFSAYGEDRLMTAPAKSTFAADRSTLLIRDQATKK